MVDRTVSSVTSRRLSTPAPQKEQDESSASENAAPESTDDALAEAEGANEAASEAEPDATAQTDTETDATAETPLEAEPLDAEPTEADAAKPNPEDLERVELELHLYQTGWMPTQEEQEGIELEAMASTLTTRQRQGLKSRTIRGCESLASYIDISDLNISTGVSTSVIRDVISEAINENPDLFYVHSADCGWSGGIYYYIYLYYWEGFDNASTASQMRSNYEASLKDVLSWVPLTSGYYDQCKAVHDWLVKVCVYTQDVADGKDWINTHSGFEKYRPYTAYGALVVHDAVCNGYALAFLAAMNRLGIPCVFVSSGAINHAWNLVQINGYWYHIDCT